MTREPSVWQEFFAGHAPLYDDNVFTKNTLAEVDFPLGMHLPNEYHRERRPWLALEDAPLE